MAKNTIKIEGAFDYGSRVIANNNFADVGYCTTQFDAVTGTTGTTLTNVVGMVTDTLQPGTYRYQIHIAGVATANCGMKLGLKQGTASMLTSLENTTRAFTASAVAVTHSTSTTDQASLLAATTAYINVVLEGTVVVATAGTLQLQAAQNAAHADTTSVYAGSYMTFTKIG